MIRTLIQDYAEHEWSEYRIHLALMDQIADTCCFNGNAWIHLSEAIKNALDLKGNLAPNKSGVWSESCDNKAWRTQHRLILGRLQDEVLEGLPVSHLRGTRCSSVSRSCKANIVAPIQKPFTKCSSYFSCLAEACGAHCTSVRRRPFYSHQKSCGDEGMDLECYSIAFTRHGEPVYWPCHEPRILQPRPLFRRSRASKVDYLRYRRAGTACSRFGSLSVPAEIKPFAVW